LIFVATHANAMPFKFLALLLLVSCFSFAQRQSTTEQINRLADAGKVYGYIKYFHPLLQHKKINWDSAFAANVEGIIEARNKEQYADVIQKILSTLSDGLTTVISAPDKAATFLPKPLNYSVYDSILHVAMNDAPEDGTTEKLQEALQNMPKVKAAIFDMRRPINSVFVSRTPAGYYFDKISSYFKGYVVSPAYQTICYEGLPPAITEESSDYREFLKVGQISTNKGSANKVIPQVFIVNNIDQVPLTTNELQRMGKVAIVQDGSRELIPGESIRFYIQDSVLVRLRVGDAVNADGTVQIITPNAKIAGDSAYFKATSIAEEIIQRGIAHYSLAGQRSLPVLEPGPKERYINDNDYPSLGFRIVAASKIFSAIDHFFPNKSLMSKNWEECYKASIPKFIAAKDSFEYMRAVAELYSNINDGHGFILRTGGSFGFRMIPLIQGRGTFTPPFLTRLVDSKVIIWDIVNDSVCRAIGIRKGDVILSIDGKDPIREIDSARRYQSASTEKAQTWLICSYILFGKRDQITTLAIQDRNGKIKHISMPVIGDFKGHLWEDYPHRMYSRNVKSTYKLLTNQILYVDLTSPLDNRDADSAIILLRTAKATIFDMRGYPGGGAHRRLFDQLAKSPSVVVSKFTECTRSSPNIKDFDHSPPGRDADYTFVDVNDTHVGYQINHFKNNGWIYPGKVVVLIDEVAISWAEHNCLIFKATCNATFIGSPTAGADGYMTNFSIPGNLTLLFSGENVSYPDGRPLQRVGVQPDIYIRPTIKGVQAGRDEVLDRAVKYLETGK
jgi:C-terminal processing protease CtpA/Prc